ncbi:MULTISPECIES: hypothetical protein [unclassified Streptomyces]|uniref:hypothetical protein n=1 Tax=unclassified Streptomyces TaxID=2593676 RepID=UPI0036E0AEEB
MPPPTGLAARRVPQQALALAVLLFALAMTPVAGAETRTPTPTPTPTSPASRTAAPASPASWTAAPASPASWTARPTVGASAVGASGVSASGSGGRPYVYLEGPPGTVLQDRLSVTNSGTAPVTVRLRGADADHAQDSGHGATGPTETGTGTGTKTGTETGTGTGTGTKTGTGTGTGTGAWLRTAVAEVTVPARTRADVPFSVTVPTGATPGDHSGAILVESGDRSVGVRVHVRVGGPTLAALTVEDVSVSGRTVHYTLVNRGNTVLTPRIAVHADGVFGALLRRAARTLPVELLPGQRVRLGEPWRDAPALDSVTVRLRVTASGGAHGEATARAVFVPWAAVTGGALLLLAAVAAGAYAYRLRRSRGRSPEDAGSGQSSGDQRHSGTRRSGTGHVVKAGAES